MLPITSLAILDKVMDGGYNLMLILLVIASPVNLFLLVAVSHNLDYSEGVIPVRDRIMEQLAVTIIQE